jgi:hypothetical protein
MDDYRDLVSASLALLCAGVMLVAGQLFIEWQARHAASGVTIEAPADQPSSPMSSNDASPSRTMIELPTETRRKRPA